MTAPARIPLEPRGAPALRRLAALGALTPADREALEQALSRTHAIRARGELVREGQPLPAPVILAAGWAARVRLLVDGRRQFVSFVLPGDVIGLCRQHRPIAASTIVALTDVAVCPAPSAPPGGALDHVYGVGAALEEAYLCANIVRLGRLNAQERIGDLLLEFHERLSLAGLAAGGAFEVPLTQEMIGDALGLTSVHVNRMLQQARRDNSIGWDRGRVVLYDMAALAAQLGRVPPRVSALA